MRIATNQVSALLKYYHSELLSIHDTTEIEALFALAVGHYLGISKKDLTKHLKDNLNQSDVLKIYDCVKSLQKHIPIQYILGSAWFLDLKLKVNAYVLIPRPETEELVDKIIKENTSAKSFLDIGTGSACIPIAIKSKLPAAKVFACDISEAALKVAHENAIVLNTDVNFFQVDVINTPVFLKVCTDTFDVIVSNPPYIRSDEKDSLSKHVIEQEPHLALFVEDKDATIFYKKIIELCAEKLNPGGHLYFELNPLTAYEVEKYAQQSGLFKSVELLKDMSDKWRFLKGIREK